MPPPVALLLTLWFIFYLFRREARRETGVSRALWVPLIWLLIIQSRFVSEWLATWGISLGGGGLEEGSLLDALVFLGLIVAGLIILNQRRVRLGKVIHQNAWLFLFFLYCFLAVFWSDYATVAFKRWFKVLGHPILVLVLFSEADPEAALVWLMKRCAFVIVPVSVLFIKYYPEYGRGFSSWTGEGYNTGITLGKNALGTDCYILGIFFFWYLLKVLSTPRSPARRRELVLCYGFLVMIFWLINKARSSTALVSMAIGMGMIAILGMRFFNKRFIGTYLLIGLATCATLEFSFGVSASILELLGEDPTLTDRTELWQDCLEIPINTILGAGFESFWLGPRLEAMWQKWNWGPNQAHNGYLETYLNLGAVGFLLLIGVIISTFWNARRELLNNFHFGRFRVAFLLSVIAYNWTEASFKALHPVWFVFYIVAIDYRRPRSQPVETQNAGPVSAQQVLA